MDAAIIQLGLGLGLQDIIGYFAPIYIGISNILPFLLTLFFYADKSADYNERGESKPEIRYDFIIVGSGSAGSIVANRLSKNFNVLLLEQGGEPSPFTTVPGLQGALLGRPQNDYGYLTVPQNSSCLSMNNRQCLWNAGFGLGGSHMINGMIYIRGHPFDYNRWAKVTKDDRWKYANVLPFMMRSEEYCGDCDPSDGTKLTIDPKYHSSEGELPIRPPPFGPMVQEFLEAQQWGGVARADLNAPYYRPAADPVSYTLNRGRRVSSFHAFVAPLRGKRKSLTVLKHARVIQVIFDNKINHAVGVKFVRFGKVEVCKASKEVILSAGSIGTPKLLMLSGIGPADDLNKLDISVRSNLPVGIGLQDHIGTLLGPFLIDKPVSLLPGRDLNEGVADEWLQNGTGPWSIHYLRANSMWVSQRAIKAGEVQWPDVQIMMSSNGIAPSVVEDYDRNYNMRKDVLQSFFGPLLGKDAFSFLIDNGRPKSRGVLTLKSNNYMDNPIINPRYYEDSGKEDIRVIVEGIQRAVYLVDTAPSYKLLGARLAPMPFPPCKDKLFRSDSYWECFVRHFTLSIRHYVGTASMGVEGSGKAVVDSELKVIGVKGLRVIDASVMPYIVSTNPNAATMMIAERGAEFVIEKYSKI